MSIVAGPPLRSLIPILLAAAVALVVAIASFGAGAVDLMVFIALLAVGQWAVAPWVVRWMVRPRAIPHDGRRYLARTGSSDDRVGRIVARRCASAGLPLVQLGIIETATANAFTYGRTHRSARVVVTTGLLGRLTDEELDAVICHELAHVRHRDAAMMTFLGVVPMALYLVGHALIATGDDDDYDDDDDGSPVLLGLAVLAAYLVVELLLLSFSRAREHAADRWACEHTANGDALASALVKVAQPVKADDAVQGDAPDKHTARVERRLDSVGALGLRGPELPAAGAAERTHEAMVDAFKGELSRRRRLSELLATHPTVARRIADLERSGLPGAPRRLGLTAEGRGEAVPSHEEGAPAVPG